ncbi:MAG: transglutaminase domain-containing protein [Sphingomonadales bacterium]|nr:transglutaminase domain-containing protein [Sphingomonadales bacterium]
MAIIPRAMPGSVARGDCTEDAVLLAALARTAGIPARVASGLVYDRERFHGARDAFLPHSWTLAWIDGRWRSFDISIGTFDATHIALSLGDGEPEAILSGWQIGALLKWRAMAEIRPSTPARQ